MKKRFSWKVLSLLVLVLSLGAFGISKWLMPSTESSDDEYTTFHDQFEHFPPISEGVVVIPYSLRGQRIGEVYSYGKITRAKHLAEFELLGSWEDLTPEHQFKLLIYQNQTGKVAKTIDLLKTVREYNVNYIPFSLDNEYYDLTNQRYYLGILVSDKAPKDSNSRGFKNRVIYLDVESGQLQESLENYRSSFVNETSYPNIYAKEASNVQEKLEARGITNPYKEAISIKKPLDIALFKEYGEELAWINGEEENEARLVQTTAEAGKTIAQLLAVDGETDVFQGVTLYAAYSKDGQDHLVGSYEEFMEWYQAPSEANKE